MGCHHLLFFNPEICNTNMILTRVSWVSIKPNTVKCSVEKISSQITNIRSFSLTIIWLPWEFYKSNISATEGLKPGNKLFLTIERVISHLYGKHPSENKIAVPHFSISYYSTLSWALMYFIFVIFLSVTLDT